MTHDRYHEIRAAHQWQIPSRYNIGVDICDRIAATHPDATAMVWEDIAGTDHTITYGWLRERSNRLANGLRAQGLQRGDRVAVLLGQRPETAVAHIAILKAGLVSVPLFTAFAEDALAHRIANAGARALITDAEQLPKAVGLLKRGLDLRPVLCIGGAENGILAFDAFLDSGAPDFQPVDTSAEDDALIIYTSGTTGPPKGARHAHRMLIGHDPGIRFVHHGLNEGSPDRHWSPQDWAWVAGLVNILFASLRHRVPVIATARRFDPEWAWRLLEHHQPTRAFIPPTALHQMRRLHPAGARNVALRSVGTGGESVSPGLIAWGQEVLGADLNEAYGQTECNMIVGNSASVMPVRLGSMGRAMPGHDVALVDETGQPAGDTGIVAVRRGDPVMFLEYWNDPEATRAKFAGDWLLTGDIARRDADGYLYYVGRNDDVINTAGYRVGPGEIEDALISHAAVAAAGVIGVADPERGQIIQAFVELRPGTSASDALSTDLQNHVRGRLARHLYPRTISFIAEMPRTVTGKVRREALRTRANAAPTTDAPSR
ncbi:MAG: AMP-binding protein [Proteobacteria bacterium]|nr:AMP-binding protein [Pseudomonadota bacterium]